MNSHREGNLVLQPFVLSKQPSKTSKKKRETKIIYWDWTWPQTTDQVGQTISKQIQSNSMFLSQYVKLFILNRKKLFPYFIPITFLITLYLILKYYSSDEMRTKLLSSCNKLLVINTCLRMQSDEKQTMRIVFVPFKISC